MGRFYYHRNLKIYVPEKLAPKVLVLLLSVAPTLVILFLRCRTVLGPLVPHRWPVPAGQTVAIVVRAHGDLDKLAVCLDSWQRHTASSYMYVVDDVYARYDRDWVERLAFFYSNLSLVAGEPPNRSPRYTNAFNVGFRAAFADGFNYIVQLQSDAVLTPNWLPPLVTVLRLRDNVGAVIPFSNAWRTIPGVSDAPGDWNLAPLPFNWRPEMVAKLVFLLGDNRIAQLPFLCGAAIAYRRAVFVDYEEGRRRVERMLAPTDFGGESKFTFYIQRRGYSIALAPMAYVHQQVQPHGAENRSTTAAAREIEEHLLLRRRDGADLARSVQFLRENSKLREAEARLLHHWAPTLPALLHDVSAVFILNAMHSQTRFALRSAWVSIVQEALALSQRGFYVRLAVPFHLLGDFCGGFPRANAAGVFTGFEGMTPEAVVREFLEAGIVFDFVIAAHAMATPTALALSAQWTNSVPVYYAQQIEAPTAAMQEIFSALEAASGFSYVNSERFQTQLREEYRTEAVLLPPSLDLGFFTPGKQDFKGKLHLCAMPQIDSEPLSNTFGTLKILSWAAATFGSDKLNATVYGASRPEVNVFLKQQNNTYVKMSLINVVDPLDRKMKRSMYQQCDIFLDLSAGLASGRAGLEAMAGGALPVLLAEGAAHYAEGGVNSFLVDATSDEKAHEAFTQIMGGKHDLVGMRKAALTTAAKYSMEASSEKTAAFFRDFWKTWRTTRSQSYLL